MAGHTPFSKIRAQRHVPMRVYAAREFSAGALGSTALIRYWLISDKWEMPVHFDGSFGRPEPSPVRYRKAIESMPDRWQQIYP